MLDEVIKFRLLNEVIEWTLWNEVINQLVNIEQLTSNEIKWSNQVSNGKWSEFDR